jgi:hypothetical protein
VGKKVHIATIYVRARVSGEKMEVPDEKIKAPGEKKKFLAIARNFRGTERRLYTTAMETPRGSS